MLRELHFAALDHPANIYGLACSVRVDGAGAGAGSVRVGGAGAGDDAAAGAENETEIATDRGDDVNTGTASAGTAAGAMVFSICNKVWGPHYIHTQRRHARTTTTL